jgi:hypothetical protein
MRSQMRTNLWTGLSIMTCHGVLRMHSMRCGGHKSVFGLLDISLIRGNRVAGPGLVRVKRPVKIL